MKMQKFLFLFILIFMSSCKLPKLDKLFLETFNIFQFFQNRQKSQAGQKQPANPIQNGLSEGMPIFTPTPGEFYNTTTVRLSTTLSHSLIRYTLDGSDPFCGNESDPPIGTKFEVDISLPQPTIPAKEIRAIACFSAEETDTDAEKTQYTQIASGFFTVTNGILDPPILGTATGSFPASVSLTISKPASHPDSEIHYTTDGTNPTCSSPLYGAPIEITSSMNVYAITCKEDWTSSNQVGGFYEITGTVAIPMFSAGTDMYFDDFSLSLSIATAGANIRYAVATLSDPDPVLTDCSSGILYSGAIAINSNNTRIVAIGCRAGWVDSAVSPMRTYTMKVVNPTLTPVGNVYQNNINVTGSTTTGSPSTSGGTVHFRLFGAAQCTDSSSPVSLIANQGGDITSTVNAIGCKTNYLPSDPVQATYTLTGTLPEPVISPVGTSLTETTNVTITSGAGAPPTGVFHLYTTNGTDPICPATGVEYDGTPIVVSSAVTIKARSCRTTPFLWNPSSIRTEAYTFSGQASAPTFSASPGLESGAYKNVQTVTISSATSGAIIRYTVGDGTQTAPDCTVTGTEGSSVIISNNSSNVIKAIACHGTFTPSIVSTSPTYLLKAGTPVLAGGSPGPGTYQTAQILNFNSPTTGAIFHYTLNGENPTCSDPSPPIALNTSPTPATTVKVIACRAGFENSNIFSGVYEITGTVANPTISDPTGLTNLVTITPNAPPVVGSQVICYRTDGTNPECSASHLGTPSNTGGFCAANNNVYTAEIPIPSTTTILARSCASNWTMSAVETKEIFFFGSVGDVFFTPDLNLEFNQDVNVSLSALASSAIFYTLDGSTPTCDGTGTLYSTAIPINQTGVTINAIGCAPLRPPSNLASRTSNLKVAMAILTNPPGSNPLDNDIILNWTRPTIGATYLYRLDGSGPDCADPTAPGTNSLGATLNLPTAGHSGHIYNLRIIGCRTGFTASNTASFDYEFQVAMPNLLTRSGDIFQLPTHTINTTDIFFSVPTNSAKICVTLDATNPGCSVDGNSCVTGTEYLPMDDFYSLVSTTEIRAVGCRPGYLGSFIQTRNFNHDSDLKRIFLSNTMTNGDMNVSGADSLCAFDFRNPTSGTAAEKFKALRYGGGRTFTEDWPLLEGSSYYDPMGLIVGTSKTGSAGFNLPLSLAIFPSESNVWTGMTMNVGGDLGASTATCSGWTNSTSGIRGEYGDASALNQFSFQTADAGCNIELPLYCIETGVASPPVKRMFVTESTYQSNFGGIANADAHCNNDNKYPGSGTFKAIIGSHTPPRDINNNWPLTPNTTYYQSDGTTMFMVTDSEGRPTAPVTSENYNGGSGSGFGIHGGFQSNFEVVTSTSIGICNNWAATGNPHKGFAGESNYSHLFQDGNSFFQNSVQTNCGSAYRFLCAEQ
jgi:hypothetical protein